MSSASSRTQPSRASAATLDRLRAFGTPSISNALEILGYSPAVGFTNPDVRLMTGTGPFVGYVLTATMRSRTPRIDDEPFVATETYWQYVGETGGPSIVVVQDLDPEPLGAMYGEVQGRLHRALGSVGVITNGAVRDIGELDRVGFPVIAGRACVSHAFARFYELDVPVTVAGLAVEPGDLLHADRHGVQRIPPDANLDELATVTGQIESLEAELFAAADATSSLAPFMTTWTDVRSRWPALQGREQSI